MKKIDHAIKKFVGSFGLKYKLEDTAMDLWVNKVKEKVQKKISP